MTRVQHAVEELQALLDNADAGDRVGGKAELAAQFGVSTGTLNQAARLLQARGSIELRPGPRGGIFAATPDPLERMSTEALLIGRGASLRRDAVRLRRALDPLLVDDAIMHITPAISSRIVGILDNLRAAAEANDLDGFTAVSWKFQLAIAEISEYEFTRLVFMTAIQLLRESTPQAFKVEDDLPHLYRRHLALWEALRAGDRDTALEIVDQALTRMA